MENGTEKTAEKRWARKQYWFWSADKGRAFWKSWESSETDIERLDSDNCFPDENSAIRYGNSLQRQP